MNTKFFIYALFVTALTTVGSWSKMLRSVANSGSGSSWSSNSYHGGSYGGGVGGGGGHK
jgi:hypothetical protein